MKRIIGKLAVPLSIVMVAGLAGVSAASADTSAVTCEEQEFSVTVASGTETISAEYCQSGSRAADNVTVLVPGATYHRAYWDFPVKSQTYSYARNTTTDDMDTLAIDRIGSGESSKPPSVTVTSTAQADAIHQVVDQTRENRGYDTVILGGHSMGSIQAIMSAATYKNVDAVMVTGITHKINLVNFTKFLAVWSYPATLDPDVDRGLDFGYLTTKPGVRKTAFHDPGVVDPAVIETDEETKDIYTIGELPDGAGTLLLLQQSVDVDVPVIVAVGEKDKLLCGGITGSDCTSSQAIADQEEKYFPSSPCVAGLVMPGVGHDINLHPSAPELQDKLQSWTTDVVDGGCPQGAYQ